MSHINFLRTYGQRGGANVAKSPTCTYIAGERPYGDNPWCGAPSAADSSYCEKHHRVCYEPVDRKKQRDFQRSAEFAGKIAK